ncbi:type IV secretory system conjugative DNA transfer family protein [Acerihabitans sp. TG2]|uniref:type IV secretory system conjugative DNA transfer family protein n=1 Tax=Acerihabitans sp. TG2 TaxID=3096008 RepID=UPI002B23416C|nr:type IV secretory system conjugative DNA transfer family protein [Acerihabitans sp. TG2]MEA9392228.1 type IV secretory system conjugative DNA transfer family protein [Acerihabitans sp. TG2]
MSDMPPVTLEQLQGIYTGNEKIVDPSSTLSDQQLQSLKNSGNVAESARKQALYDTGLNIGVRGGLAFQLNSIRNSIESHQRDFDIAYDFSNLMIQDRVIPPVIAQMKDVYNQDGDLTLRLSGASYEIVSQAKFSSVPPNWRGYLSFPKSNFTAEFLNTALRPKGSDEQKLFNLAMADGWNQGVENANLMLTQALDRLNRDLKGMLLFHQFVVEGKVTMPIIASSEIPVTHDGNTMTVDNTLLRITRLPDFNAKPGEWHSTFSSRTSPNRVFSKINPLGTRK